MNIAMILMVADKAITVLKMARDLGLLPKDGLAEKVLNVIVKAGTLATAGADAAQRVDGEMKELTEQLERIETGLKNNAGAAEIEAEFAAFDKRGDDALARIAAEAKRRGLT